jgi:hypothetical protein
MPANRKNQKMLDLLISYNAKVPDIFKMGTVLIILKTMILQSFFWKKE